MEDQDAFLNSVALNLYSFYNGLERVMEWVALEMDGGTLCGLCRSTMRAKYISRRI
jgi:hypothetical protein